MNCRLQSEVISLGTSNLEIHSQKSTLACMGAVESVIGMALVQQVNLSMMVKRVSTPLRGCEVTYDVHMEMVKMAVQFFEVLQESTSMLADLALVTVQAQFPPVADVLVRVGPHKFTGDCSKSRLFGQVARLWIVSNTFAMVLEQKVGNDHVLYHTAV